MARGLAYYTGVIFEVRVLGLGAQNQICGGGRYDNLVKMFSGLEEPAVGFAFGFDRLLDAVETQKKEFPKEKEVVVVAAASEEARGQAFEISNQIRVKTKLRVDLDLMNRKLGRILEYASKTKAKYVVIVGIKELKEGKIVLRDMAKGEQKEIKLADLEKLL
jgi:histidyl-tRNA synthetase